MHALVFPLLKPTSCLSFLSTILANTPKRSKIGTGYWKNFTSQEARFLVSPLKPLIDLQTQLMLTEFESHSL